MRFVLDNKLFFQAAQDYKDLIANGKLIKELEKIESEKDTTLSTDKLFELMKTQLLIKEERESCEYKKKIIIEAVNVKRIKKNRLL